MLRMLDQSDLLSNPRLANSMLEITEHHARILSRLEDHKTRARLLFMIVNEKLTVKELSNIVIHLRSWFITEDRFLIFLQGTRLLLGY